MPGTILFGIDVESASEHSTGFARFGAELFRNLGVPVTWYLTGKTLERYPGVFREIQEGGGIELQAHTYNHILLKTVCSKLPEGRTLGGCTDWSLTRGGSVEEIDADLGRCQRVFEEALGRRATALTGPWTYYRGLRDRPDLLEIVDRHGFRILRTFGRNEHDAEPVPLEWQPFFYDAQGFPHTLEIMINGYIDDFTYAFFAPDPSTPYVEYLKSFARRVAETGLTWGLCSHDHNCRTREGFNKKGDWFREIAEYALGLNIRFLTASQYGAEMAAQRHGTP